MKTALRKPRWRVLVVLAAALIIALSTQFGRGPLEASPPLDDVDSIEALQARFNADSGDVRLILLLSPT
jgi:hypothetical protein